MQCNNGTRSNVDLSSLVQGVLGGALSHCQTVVETHSGLLTSLLLAGLLGGLTHCAGMCGPFVLSQTVARLEVVPAREMREWHRLAGAALVPYHLGRATTYALLGALAALIADGMIAATGLKWLSAALLLLAALFFATYALHQLAVRLPWSGGSDGGGLWSRYGSPLVRPLFARPVGWRGYLLGVALGFLPCGLLYGALAAAASSSGPLAGAFAMLAFALGTVPALLLVGIAGHVAAGRFMQASRAVMPVLMLLNAAALSYFAWRTLA